MDLFVTIGVILGATIITSIVIHAFEKSTMEATRLIDAEYVNMHRYYRGGFESED